MSKPIAFASGDNASVSPPAPNPTGIPAVNKPLAFVVGDSISVHYGPHIQTMIAPRYAYARKTGAEPALAGTPLAGQENGGDSSCVLAYLRQMAGDASFRPAVLAINCGLHDIRVTVATGAKQVPLDLYRSNLAEIFVIARRCAGRVVWIRTTPVDDQQHNGRTTDFRRHAADLALYNAAADELAAAAAVASIDLHAFTAGLGGNPFCDHVHFLEPVRQLQAAFIAGHLLALA